MLHNRASDEKSQVAALSLIGMHLSEMISDGYLIFILNSENAHQSLMDIPLTHELFNTKAPSGQNRFDGTSNRTPSNLKVFNETLCKSLVKALIYKQDYEKLDDILESEACNVGERFP